MSTGGTTGAIRAGMAYVQAYLDDNPVTQGLAKLQTKIKSWQASLSQMGAASYGGELPEPFAAIARFAASPAGAFSALIGAAKLTADAREEMLRMSETTGVAVDKLSQYSYAARRAGISAETFASALKRMEGKEFMAQMQGARGGGVRGITSAAFAAMGQGDAVDRLREFIRLTQNMPTEEKIGLARRLGLSELLPLISQGIDSLDAMTARAKALGLVMSEQDAKAGKQFELALGDLHDVLMSSVKTIGGALVPMISGLTGIITNAAVAVRDWIKEHKALFTAIFLTTGAIVAGGLALKGFAVAVGVVSAAVRALQILVKAATVAFSVFTTVVAWLPILANPFVLAGIAIAGLLTWLTSLTGAFSRFGELVRSVAGDFSKTMQGITNALAKGDLKGGFAVLVAFLRLEWTRLVDFMAEALSRVVNSAMDQMADMMAVAGLGPGAPARPTKWKPDPRIKKAEEELNKAVAAANASAATPGNAEASGKAFAAMQNTEVRGTFSAAAAGMLGGGGSTLERIAKATEWSSDALRRQVAEQEKLHDTMKNVETYLKGVGIVL